MKGLLRHKPVFKSFRFFLKYFFRLKFNYEFEIIEPAHKSYIVLSNHTTNYDPLMVGLSFPGLLYYVASEHIFRWGFVSNLIRYLVDPIPRLKATAEVQTVKQILKRLKNGGNVCIFAEGNRTFNGETGGIPESTGKLIKLSGAALITYRLEGGYFSNPRWGRSLRKGAMYGRKITEYSPEQIEKMTAGELNAVIRNDLYVNAYRDQDQNPIPYDGKNLAENLEVSLYLCPECGRIASLKSKDNRFFCRCGLHLCYDPYGSLSSVGERPSPFKTVLDWSRWQSLKIAEQAEDFRKRPSTEVITSDKCQKLWKIEKTRRSRLVCEGTLSLYNDRIVMESLDGKKYTFKFSTISDMAIYSRMILIFSTTGHESFEIKSSYPRSAIKYLDLYKALKTTDA